MKRRIFTLAVSGCLFGTAIVFAVGYILPVPLLVFPGVILAFMIAGSEFDGVLLVPCNAAAYTIIFVAIGLLRVRKRRRTDSRPSCAHCGYCLTGNTSWICPECGTEFAPITEAMRSDARKFAILAERYLDGAISWQQWRDEMGKPLFELFDRIEDASELYYEIEHEPKVIGFLGISKAKNEERIADIRRLIANLKAGTST